MANIRVDMSFTIFDGAEATFKSPCDCSEVTGLKVYYPNSHGMTVSKTFAFVDAHGNDVANINELFLENAMVKVVLDCTNRKAFVQNADTNSYIEGQFAQIRETLPVVVPNKVLWEWTPNCGRSKLYEGGYGLTLPEFKNYKLFAFELSTKEDEEDLNPCATVIGYKETLKPGNGAYDCVRAGAVGGGIGILYYCGVDAAYLNTDIITGNMMYQRIGEEQTNLYCQKIIGII